MVRSMRSEFGMKTVADLETEEAETSTTIVVPMSSREAHEIEIFDRTLMSPDKTPVILGFSQSLCVLESAHKWQWRSLEFLSKNSNRPDSASSGRGGRFRDSQYGYFLALPAGDLLYADVSNQDVLGRSVLIVNLQRTSRWSFKGIIPRTAGTLNNRMPQWLSVTHWSIIDSIRVGKTVKCCVSAWLAEAFLLKSHTRPKVWILDIFCSITGGFGIGIPQTSASGFTIGVLGSLLRVSPVENHYFDRHSMIERKHWFYTSPLFDIIKWIYFFVCLRNSPTAAEILFGIFFPPLLRSPWAIYRSLRLFWTVRPRFVDSGEAVSVLPQGILKYVVLSWILACNTWGHASCMQLGIFLHFPEVLLMLIIYFLYNMLLMFLWLSLFSNRLYYQSGISIYVR